MKNKFFRLLPLFLVAVFGLSLAACGDDNDEPVSSDQLPQQSKTFISQYFPGATVVSTVKDKDEYEVMLSEGTRIDFNKAGEWTDVDAAIGKTVPTGFYPAAIDTYLDTTIGGAGINEISKETYGYDVELISGADLHFSYAGAFIGYGD